MKVKFIHTPSGAVFFYFVKAIVLLIDTLFAWLVWNNVVLDYVDWPQISYWPMLLIIFGIRAAWPADTLVGLYGKWIDVQVKEDDDEGC